MLILCTQLCCCDRSYNTTLSLGLRVFSLLVSPFSAQMDCHSLTTRYLLCALSLSLSVRTKMKTTTTLPYSQRAANDKRKLLRPLCFRIFCSTKFRHFSVS